MKRTSRTLLALSLSTGLVAVVSGTPGSEDPLVPLGLPAEPLVAARPAPALVALGERLFHDEELSLDRSLSCATCHEPERAFTDGLRTSPGVGGRSTRRNTPTIFNRALGEVFMWDGSAATLEEQVLLPIQNELEMALPLADALARIQADEAYSTAFAAYAGGPPNEERLAAALAAFVRSQLAGDTLVDRFQSGELDVLSPAARAGAWIFESTGACWKCHSGPNFTDELFHNTGIGSEIPPSAPDYDAGRFEHTGDESDRGRFKTPTLRELTRTAPYMHDGSLPTLADVVQFYRDGGRANANLDSKMKPIEMTDENAANLVAFLEALSRP